MNKKIQKFQFGNLINPKFNKIEQTVTQFNQTLDQIKQKAAQTNKERDKKRKQEREKWMKKQSYPKPYVEIVPNDNIWVNTEKTDYTKSRPKNPERKVKVQGPDWNSLWTYAGMALPAVPLAVAAAPTISSILANPYVDAAIGSAFAGNGTWNMITGNADWMTPLEMMPLAGPAFKGINWLSKASKGTKQISNIVSTAIPKTTETLFELKPKPLQLSGHKYVSPVTRRVSFNTSEPILSEHDQGKILDKVIFPARKDTKYKSIFESDLPMLEEMVKNGEYKIVTVKLPRKQPREVKVYFPKGNKQPINETDLNQLLLKSKASKLTPILTLKEANKKAKEIRKLYSKMIEENKTSTGIDWSDQSGVMAKMPVQLKTATVGFDNKIPFLERYYRNVMKVIGEKGIQKKLLDSGELRKNSKKLWEGLINGQYQLVDPTDYIKMRIANSKKKEIYRIAPRSPGASRHPMHGTKTKDWDYLRVPSSSPGKDGYFTGIQDRTPGSNKLIKNYEGQGASVPMLRMPAYEDPIMRSGGMGSSNSYGGTGKSLLQMVRERPGRIQIPTGVTDAQVGGAGVANEYNFGPNVPNPKSLWNTLDFEEGAGPLAYNYKESESNIT